LRQFRQSIYLWKLHGLLDTGADRAQLHHGFGTADAWVELRRNDGFSHYAYSVALV
jgi:hypothetical protein